MKSNGKLCPLGKLVVKALTDQDKTKTQLAAEIGASPQYLSYILYGVRARSTSRRSSRPSTSTPGKSRR